MWGDAEPLPDSCGLGQRAAELRVIPVAGRVALCCPQHTLCHWFLQMGASQEDLGSVDLGGCLELLRFRWSQSQSPTLPPWDPSPMGQGFLQLILEESFGELTDPCGWGV